MSSASVPVAEDRPALASRWFRLARTPPSPERLLKEILDGHGEDLSSASEDDDGHGEDVSKAREDGESQADGAAMKGNHKICFRYALGTTCNIVRRFALKAGGI